jgi:hypothetical protein
VEGEKIVHEDLHHLYSSSNDKQHEMGGHVTHMAEFRNVLEEGDRL